MQQRGRHASVLGRLQPFILARIEELEATLEHRAISDFNNWLVGLAPCSVACQPAWLLAGIQGALFMVHFLGVSAHPLELLLCARHL